MTADHDAPRPTERVGLTEAEREALFTRTREISVSRDTAILETIVERILAARLAEERAGWVAKIEAVVAEQEQVMAAIHDPDHQAYRTRETVLARFRALVPADAAQTLDQVKAEAAREALREAADALPSDTTMRWLHERESCDWWGERPVRDWLRDRADRIGGGTDV